MFSYFTGKFADTNIPSSKILWKSNDKSYFNKCYNTKCYSQINLLKFSFNFNIENFLITKINYDLLNAVTHSQKNSPRLCVNPKDDRQCQLPKLPGPHTGTSHWPVNTYGRAALATRGKPTIISRGLHDPPRITGTVPPLQLHPSYN